MQDLLLLFPGQGSQHEGMGEYLFEYHAGRAAFDHANDALGWDIGEICRHASIEELTRTDRAQLALLTCSVAVLRILEESGLSFGVAAGHSLGEYSALVAAGHLSFADALRVVEQRGLAMQRCAEASGGTMAAVLGLDDETVEAICGTLGEVWVANYNSPGQVVISGSLDSVADAGRIAQEKGAKKIIPLAVAGAFHTPFMAGAANALARALEKVPFTDSLGGRPRFFSTTESRFPVVSELPSILSRQLISPVRFTQSMTGLLASASPPRRGIEVGPGSVLTGLMKRIARGFAVSSSGDSDSLRKTIDQSLEMRENEQGP